MDIQELIAYWKVIKKRLWLIGLLVGITVGTILIVSYATKPIYRATVLFQVTTPPPGEVTIYREFRSPDWGEQLDQTEAGFLQILQSLDVAWQTMEALGIEMEAEDLLKMVTIEQPQEGSVYRELGVTANSPQLAATLANTLMETALRYYGELRAQSLKSSQEFINQQLDQVKNELSEAQEALIQFQIRNRVGSLSALIDSQQSLIRQLSFERDRALAEGDMTLASNYDQIIVERQRELQESLELYSEYDALRTAVDQARTTHDQLLDRKTEVKLKENELSSVGFIRVIPARERSRPLPRVTSKIVVLGVVLSLALGVMLAFFLEYLETTEVTPKEHKVSSSPSDIPVTTDLGGAGLVKIAAERIESEA